MDLQRFTVEHHSEETECPWCGGPLYVGDKGYADRVTGRAFCCKAHAQFWDRVERFCNVQPAVKS